MSFRLKSLCRRERGSGSGSGAKDGLLHNSTVSASTPPLARAKTVASGLGQVEKILSSAIDAGVAAATNTVSSSSLNATESPRRRFRQRAQQRKELLEVFSRELANYVDIL